MTSMNVTKALREYIIKMVRVTSGMKLLIMDNETTGIVSVAFSQSEILQEEVYLFERLDTPNRDVMAHLKAIVFVRPTQENLQLLLKELRKPKYCEYYLFFSNVITKKFLEDLAGADEHEVVQEVQEYFGDIFAINPDTWTLNLRCEWGFVRDDQWNQCLARIDEGLLSCLLSLKVKPYIRAQKSSPFAMEIGKDILDLMRKQKSLFKFKTPEVAPILLILDRKDDPVTPLLTQWTFQAMVHDMIGIDNNMVDLSNCATLKKEAGVKQFVLSSEQDSFFKENMYKNFGDLGIALKDLVDDYQKKAQLNQNIASIDDIKQFVVDYPQFKQLMSNVTKHMKLMSEIQSQIAKRNLLDISEFEQSLACHEDITAAQKKLDEFLANQAIDPKDLLRLVMLYMLRYETNPHNNIQKFCNLLKSRGLSDEYVKMVTTLKKYAGIEKRSPTVDLFENKDYFQIARGTIKRGLLGVTNIYTQHKPLLHTTLTNLIRGRLADNAYPFLEGAPYKEKTVQILVFMVGGITFEEAATVAELSAQHKVSIVLGGTTIHNSKSFLQALQAIGDKMASK